MDKRHDVEQGLRQMLAAVFNLESPDDLDFNSSIVGDLGADSLDFVEILHLVEQNFGVVLKTDEIMVHGAARPAAELFMDGRLTGDGAQLLAEAYPDRKNRVREGMSKIEMFSLLTVADLAAVIRSRLAPEAATC